MAKTYRVYNGPMPTTAAIAAGGVTTGTAIKTMLQIVPSYPIVITEWGFSLTAYTNTASIVELLTTGAIFGTVTAYAAADVMPQNDPNAPVNTAGATGLPLELGTALSGYTASAEGSIVATRVYDAQTNPQGPYFKQNPLGRDGQIKAGEPLRIRATFPTTAATMLCWVEFEI